ncbi:MULTISPECIES: hypothetical protein [Natronomonas]|jgi:hypothetical protein|uniref:DUF7331 family protein n=1 Tax=Natronomonas TaxID=63743 RepID=UPI0015BB697F|nr:MULTISPECIES: hypothetical protein [Natronomonas]
MPAPIENSSDGDSLPTTRDRCVDFELEGGAVVIYDRKNHNAWIQSDSAVELSSLA